MAHRLYLGRDKRIAGVCSGLADFFGVEESLVRAAFVIFTLAGGSGILAYIILMVVMVERPDSLDDL